MQTKTAKRHSDTLDYELVFQHMPGLILILDPGFTIMAQNIAHADASLSADRKVVGLNLFEAFPDNPGHSAADGVSLVRASLLKVLKTRERDVMPVIRYDVRGSRGPFEAHWWEIDNTPILDKDGYVRWIITRGVEVTELVQLRERVINGLPPGL
jgi:PAS domain-containing protein